MAEKKLKQGAAADLAYTVADLSREFPKDDACLEYIKEQRWPSSVAKCGKCNIERKDYRVAGREADALKHECTYTIHTQRGASLCPRDNILFFTFSFFVCEFTTTFRRREPILWNVEIERPATYAQV
jgi:hypothetical protein